MLINRIRDLDIQKFIEQWDQPQADASNKQHAVKKSPQGNINTLGDPVSAAAPVVTKHHPAFFDFIEEGVLALVKRIVNDLNYITFSSCQGHPAYRSHDSFAELRPRQVAILPRNEQEGEKVWLLLNAICQQTNKAIRTNSILTQVAHQRLEVFNQGYIRYWDSIALTFTPLGDASAAYFKDLEAVYPCFLTHLSAAIEHFSIPSSC